MVTMGRKKSEKTLIRELVETKKKRQYTKPKQQSWKQLGISDEHGWTNEERQLFFRLNSNLNKIIEHGNMTKKQNRKDHRTKKDFKNKKNNHSFGIWSVQSLNKIQQTGVNFIKHIVKSHFKEIKEKGKENVKILTAMKHIRKNHIVSYIEDKRSGTWGKNYVEKEEDRKPCRETSISAMVSRLDKLFECSSSFGIKSHTTVIEESKVKDTIKEISIYDRVRGVGKTDGKKGYTLEQCRKLIDSMEDNPVGKSMTQVLTYIGLRYESLSKITWDEFVDPGTKQIKTHLVFEDGSKFKGGRVFSTETTEEIRESLQDLYDTGLFKEDDKIFGFMSRYQMEKVLKTACERSGIDYKGFHEFRFATKEHFENKAEEMTKEQLVREILVRVNSVSKYTKDGEIEYPLNPVERQFKYVKDENGNRIVLKTLADGEKVYKKEYQIDENGQVVKEHKYTFDKLISRRTDYLKHIYISLSINHNRSDVSSIYEDKEQPNKNITEEQTELPHDQWEQLSLNLDEE